MVIIPAIDMQSGKCVRLTQGRRDSTTVYSENPVEMARYWAGLGAERLHIVDLDGAFDGTPVHRDQIGEMARSVDIPIQVGGGIRSLDLIESYIKSGIDKVVIGSKAALKSHFLKEACSAFPGRVVAGIDAKGGQVMVEGWTQASGRSAVELAQQVSDFGAAMIIYTDIERDGMLTGPNIRSIREMAAAVDIPVIASGGVGSVSDIEKLLAIGPRKVAGVIIGKALYTGAVLLPQALAAAKGTPSC
jgi:phosphoribosylformimino-5-aminoimidazole carboxamide ribotide isomerase